MSSRHVLRGGTPPPAFTLAMPSSSPVRYSRPNQASGPERSSEAPITTTREVSQPGGGGTTVVDTDRLLEVHALNETAATVTMTNSRVLCWRSSLWPDLTALSPRGWSEGRDTEVGLHDPWVAQDLLGCPFGHDRAHVQGD